jgi:DNA-binding GntR family transcriptional regulator
MPKIIKRLPIRDQLYDLILGEIHNGTYKHGDKLKDTELAKEYGVSRTPVREALIRLEREGYIVNHLNRGFEVIRIEKKTVLEIYTIFAELQHFALTQTQIFNDDVLAAMVKVNDRFKEPSLSSYERFKLDIEWHSMVISQCDNQTLLEILKPFENKVIWYESQYLSDATSITVSWNDHQVVQRLIKEKQFNKAAVALRRNCLRTKDIIENSNIS